MVIGRIGAAVLDLDMRIDPPIRRHRVPRVPCGVHLKAPHTGSCSIPAQAQDDVLEGISAPPCDGLGGQGRAAHGRAHLDRPTATCAVRYALAGNPRPM